jgi:hypothetical protein
MTPLVRGARGRRAGLARSPRKRPALRSQGGYGTRSDAHLHMGRTGLSCCLSLLGWSLCRVNPSSPDKRGGWRPALSRCRFNTANGGQSSPEPFARSQSSQTITERRSVAGDFLGSIPAPRAVVKPSPGSTTAPGNRAWPMEMPIKCHPGIRSARASRGAAPELRGHLEFFEVPCQGSIGTWLDALSTIRRRVTLANARSIKRPKRPMLRMYA